MAKKYHGIIPPIVTPIDENEKVNEGELRAMIEHCVTSGLHGIFVAGSNGECMGLTQAERDHAIKIAIDACGDRIPLMSGVMDTCTMRVIENIKRLEQMGGKAAVVTCEFYARHCTPDETVRHFEKISKNTNLDIFIYNIPPFTNYIMKADTIFRIAEFDHVVGYKDSSGLMVEFNKCLQHFHGTDFVLLQGITGIAGISMLYGADGFVPSIGPIFPKACCKVYEYGKARDIDNLFKWDKILSDCNVIQFLAKNSGTATKYLTSLGGITNARPTSPMEPLTEQEKTLLKQRYDAMMEICNTTE